MDKDFVPYQPSLDMKELGFDEPCLMFWIDKNNWGVLPQPGYYNNGFKWCNQNFFIFSKQENVNLTRPTFSQAFRWFKEKYGIFVSIVPNKYGNLDSFIGWIYIPLNGSTKDIDVGGRKGFNTPEEAELACLIKIIEIVKEGNNEQSSESGKNKQDP